MGTQSPPVVSKIRLYDRIITGLNTYKVPKAEVSRPPKTPGVDILSREAQEQHTGILNYLRFIVVFNYRTSCPMKQQDEKVQNEVY